MGLKLSNNASGLLALAISDSDTSLTLEAGHGSRFPALGSGDWFPITVVRASGPSQFEIMRCTARTLDTLTVERAQEGTSALAFDSGDVVELRLTAGTLEENFISRSDVTTSPTDTTAGRLLKVGDFGVGVTIKIPQGANLNDYITPGEYFQNLNANASPELNYPVQLAGSLKVVLAADGPVQEYTAFGSHRKKFLRGMTGGVWSDWVEFYHTGNPPPLIGVGQTWQNVTSSRSVGTTYTNTTGRPIFVAAADSLGANASTSQMRLYVDNKEVSLFLVGPPSSGGAMVKRITVSGIVPPGSVYRIELIPDGGKELSWWMELR